MAEIVRENDKISIRGSLFHEDGRSLLANLYEAIENRRYQQVTLDFSDCEYASPPAMVMLCTYTQKCLGEDKDFDLLLPRMKRRKRLFLNSNWAHLISPSQYPMSKYPGYRQVPATRYSTTGEQAQIVEKMMDCMLRSYTDLDRKSFAAIEWAINEITDNVLLHSESPVGGIAQLNTYLGYKTKNDEVKRIEIIVSDAGSGIYNTLKGHQVPTPNGPKIINTLTDALLYAVEEGVTNGRGQGNGLFGANNICSESNGKLVIDSGPILLICNKKDGKHAKPQIPIMGTAIWATIHCNISDLLEKALKFHNRVHHVTDYIEMHYEMKDGNTFFVKPEAHSVGSRLDGVSVRTKIRNLSNMMNDVIYIDFSDIPVASSSFLDEFIVKLIEETGLDCFRSRYKIVNLSDTILKLLDKSFRQRMNDSFIDFLNYTG
jgi:anti-anti-sigma regulatory factor/anti-sigma regulatory factor (Ser/Thr protein kinase)